MKSPTFPSTISAHKQRSAGRGSHTPPAGTAPRPTSARIISRPMPADLAFPIYEDAESTKNRLTQKRHSSTERVNDAEVRERAESTGSDLAQLDPRHLNELNSFQMNTRGDITESYSVGTWSTEYILPIQPALYHDGSETNQKSPNSSTPAFEPLRICHACDLRIHTAYGPGASWPMCTHFGCLYFNLPFAPRVPSLDSLSFGEMPIASDYWSLSQNVPRPSLQDHQQRHTYISPSNPTESMEAVSTFSNCYCVGATTDLYCGYCAEVQGPIVYDTDVYQYNSDGSCCDFGLQDSCAAGELMGDLSGFGFEILESELSMRNPPAL